MICKNCKNEIQNEVNFCPFCGKQIEKETQKRLTLIGKYYLALTIILLILSLFPINVYYVNILFCIEIIALITYIVFKYKMKKEYFGVTPVLLYINLIYTLCYVILFNI